MSITPSRPREAFYGIGATATDRIRYTLTVTNLSAKQRKHYEERHPGCQVLPTAPESLAELLQLLSSSLSDGSVFWFRGQGSYTWRLTPSALRYANETDRTKALKLLADFKRVAKIKLPHNSDARDLLDWVQLAQHFGLPTRLLDWTQNPVVALWFACTASEDDGAVFLINPVVLNRASHLKCARICDVEQDARSINALLALDGRVLKSGGRTIAVQPVWNSERLMRQQGVFTLHGSRELSLSDAKLGNTGMPSLICIPILADEKPTLRRELTRIGVDEMSLFPELEHACSHLKHIADLPRI